MGNKGVNWLTFTTKRGCCEQCFSLGVESWPHSMCSHCSIYLCVNEKKDWFVTATFTVTSHEQRNVAT
jgi:hypothetical protein